MESVNHNYAYFPIFVDKEKYGIERDELYNIFRANNIYVRRYFYPLISQFPTYRDLPSARAENLPIAEKITEEVLCLPIYADLEMNDVQKIVSIIKEHQEEEIVS